MSFILEKLTISICVLFWYLGGLINNDMPMKLIKVKKMAITKDDGNRALLNILNSKLVTIDIWDRENCEKVQINLLIHTFV